MSLILANPRCPRSSVTPWLLRFTLTTPASCKIDDDCPGAALCTARLVSSCGGDPQNSLAMAFGCQSAEDECSASDECDQTAHTLCVKGACIPGAGACGAGR